MKKAKNLNLKASKMEKVSVKEYVEKYNPKLTRRGKKMSVSYIYRLIRNDIKGISGSDKCELWFDYTLEGEKDNIFILVNKKKK